MKTFVICLLIIFAGISCDKEDNEKPIINLTSPTANQQFNGGETVNIIANITDNNDLHEVHLFVDKTTGGSIIHFMEHLDANTFTLSDSFVAEAGVTYQIVIQATDHADNVGEVTLQVAGN
jgi:Bacterial Ig domain